MKASEALERYGRRVGPVDREQNLRIVRRWLERGGQPTDAHLKRYVEEMEREGYASSTIDRHQRQIRAFYNALRIDPPHPQWKHDKNKERRPVASTRLVEAMIEAAKAGNLTAYETAYLAISTTYGARRGEIASLAGDRLDLEARRIYLLTEKGGVRRWQHIPDAIAPYLDIEWEERDPDSVSAAYASILSFFGVKRSPKDRYGWHMIRRALLRDLKRSGVSDDDAKRFIRWSLQEEREEGGGELKTYLNPSHELDLDGEHSAREEHTPEMEDAGAFARHPYVRLWA